MIRLLREAAAQNEPCPRRVRVELPLPLADLDSDALAFAGLHGQASDWSGGINQRFRVTKGLIDAFVLAMMMVAFRFHIDETLAKSKVRAHTVADA